MELIRALLSVVAFYHDICFRYLYCERVKPLNYLLLLKRQTHAHPRRTQLGHPLCLDEEGESIPLSHPCSSYYLVHAPSEVP